MTDGAAPLVDFFRAIASESSAREPGRCVCVCFGAETAPQHESNYWPQAVFLEGALFSIEVAQSLCGCNSVIMLSVGSGTAWRAASGGRLALDVLSRLLGLRRLSL